MTIFNSQRVNNDPNPWKSDTGARYPEVVYSKSLERASFEPRPEYDNNPNPILVAFREDTYQKGTVREARSAVSYWSYYLLVLRRQGIKVTEDTKDHALKVLEKLVRVYGEQGDNK